ncbi:uncharacterized protein LOC129595560 [Paramacrobiotus metropolitanus]|uniref:uncharacterized protein LOC129595560 n=1 Tax=Paramacrobiotus metropolitanus TaxID=2943436 RepID=UPI002445EAB7|nr:uncharacterized protein LOC129595560 [Paramacrobiotus metropolitanus]
MSSTVFRIHPIPTILALMCIWPIFPAKHINPGCAYREMNVFKCDADAFHMIEARNISRIPATVERIHFACSVASSRSYCYGMSQNPTALPRRHWLYSVVMEGFKATDGGRIPINSFLSTNAHHIGFVAISHSQIGYLDRDLFAGFASLHTLVLNYNDIHSIDINAFQSLTGNSARKPVLEHLNLLHNRLEELDWSTLYPLRESVEILYLADQKPGLRSIYRSGSAFATVIRDLSLNNNRLPSIPDFILNSIGLRNSNYRSFNFRKNVFCTNTSKLSYDCGCCDVQNLVQWAKIHASSSDISPALIRLDTMCGSTLRRFTNDASEIASRYAYPIAMIENTFEHCPSTVSAQPSHEPTTVAVQTTTTSAQPITTASVLVATTPKKIHAAASSEVLCPDYKPIQINCSAGQLFISQPDLTQAQGTETVFLSDGTFGCVSKLYDLHSMILELLEISPETDAQTSGQGVILAGCRNRLTSINIRDPERSGANMLIYYTDLHPECFGKFTQFLRCVSDNFLSEGEGNVQAPRLEFGFSLLTFKSCTSRKIPSDDLTANCTDGNFAFSKTNDSALASFGVRIRSDEHLDCRTKLALIHEFILNEPVATVEVPDMPSPSSVVAVCQKSQVFVSDGQPRRSRKLNLEYYAAPSKFCRQLFSRFLSHLFMV